MTMKCAEMGRNPAQLVADWLAGGRSPLLPQAAGGSVTFTQSGRAAILLAARLWRISDADEVLVPAYNCGSEISPLIATGARVSMYRVDGNARIDLADLRRRITDRTRLVHVIHYFGRPTDLTELAAFCRERNIKLLEDCALSLFSGNTGSAGDAAIFSFYKTLPTCAGGALVLRDPSQPSCLVLDANRPKQTARDALSLLKKWAKASLKLSPPTLRNSSTKSETPGPLSPSLPDIPIDYYCDADATVCRGARVTLGAVRRTNIESVVRKRRNNYELLRRSLSGTKNTSLLWNEPLDDPEICPLGLPLLVRNKTQWCEQLNASGIEVSPWWSGCHRGLNWNEYPEALDLKARLILLPVHQNLDARHMEHVAHKVRSLALILE
jgi:perosamine synthetase